MSNSLNHFPKRNIHMQFLQRAGIGIAVIFISAACASKATPPPVDVLATNIALGVSSARTLTAEAPTPLPTATASQTPIPPTNTPIVLKDPTVKHFAPCWFGPGPAYNLESNISEGEKVEIVAAGSIPGWYIIINPYFHQRCWIRADDLNLDPLLNPSMYPVITPLPTRIPPTPSKP